jgi:hypothetical protein
LEIGGARAGRSQPNPHHQKSETDDFGFKKPTKAKKVDVKDLKGVSALPDHFKKGAAQ